MSITEQDVTTIIGLEVHVQLKTDSKLFCGCRTEFGAPPNTLTCPVCTGMPGTLPVVNRKAMELAIQTGIALNCEIARTTKWDRKNYFYPDLPKGYQISQFDQPICGPGWLDICDTKHAIELKRIRILRAHLEEDAGKSLHDESGPNGMSRIDLNRTGTPLLEIVTEPDMRSGIEARVFLSELKLILTYLGVSDCNMQEGSLRVDANVNLHISTGDDTIATPIVEIKNLNSFRSVQRALVYESARQLEAWKETGQTIDDAAKQTHGWNDSKQQTYLQREKEDSSDYRYFPDPDLVPICFSEQELERHRSLLDPLPEDYRQQLKTEFGLSEYNADVIVAAGRDLVRYFLSAAEIAENYRAISNWITQYVLRYLNANDSMIGQFPVSPEQLGEFVNRIDKMGLDQTKAELVLDSMIENGTDAGQAVERLGIQTVDSNEIEQLCLNLLDEHPEVVDQIKSGNLKAVGALVGAARKLNRNVNPGQVREKLLELISSSDGD